jgi:hypothetical protein
MRVGWVLAVAVVACSGDDTSNIPPPDAGAPDTGRDVSIRDQYVPDTSLPLAATVQVGNCPAFTACGGQVDGTWDYTGGCLPDPFLDAQAACSSIMVQNQTASIQGRVSFAGGKVTRNGVFSYTSSATVPKVCADTFGGCSSISAVIKTQAGFDKSYCTGTGDCACTFSITRTDTSTDTYTTASNQITTGSGDAYDYCVAGLKLDYSHVSGPSTEKGVFELTHE